jgi:short-subunit dehydrogenase
MTLAARGAHVLAVARRKDRLDQLAKMAAAGGAAIEPFVADLSGGEGVSAVVRRISALQDVEMLVNCAGIATAGTELDVFRKTPACSENFRASRPKRWWKRVSRR